MLIGPVFGREATIAPRRPRTYIARAGYALTLLILMVTTWSVLTGTQEVRDVGDLARFGTVLFQFLALLQLTLALFFSAMLAASAVAQEKDRRTLVLLLLTNLTNCELVLGKLLASLLGVLTMLAAGLPIFLLVALFGGVSFGQVANVFAITLVSILACGSLGSTLALWREKTFQALAMTVLVLVLWLAVWEAAGSGQLGTGWESWAAVFSPWRAVLEATRPYVHQPSAGMWISPIHLFLVAGLFGSLLLNGLAVWKVRRWNSSGEGRIEPREEVAGQAASIWGAQHDAEKAAQAGEKPTTAAASSTARTRRVWDNPILWREVRTWAYGRRILAVRLAYLVMFGLATFVLVGMVESGRSLTVGGGAMVLVPLFLLGLILVNAQAVTSLTSERDAKALDLLLVTDLTPKEIVFGKLGGVFYNTKEMIVLPVLLCVYLYQADMIGLENLILLVLGLAVMVVFVAVLGIHVGMNYNNSRHAIATSLGTVFFLIFGVAACMWMIVKFSGSFQPQLHAFLAFMIGGGIGLYVALGARNPSPAIGLASFLCPFATFYAITSYLLGSMLAVFLVTVFTYGFATATMLIPAIHEFDIATGKTTVEEQ